ncbi:hypothetical protein DFH07DRAFT_769141 [Mycena maculata]|uniref:Uncharacterized protein n=1 Tax=Mycena maculata TaxID=230809 RepID=A0AAD7NNR8_9AGAR|nr:hypothetical protein DFH07DRAFT_769141 [Mycena maculata]
MPKREFLVHAFGTAISCKVNDRATGGSGMLERRGAGGSGTYTEEDHNTTGGQGYPIEEDESEYRREPERTETTQCKGRRKTDKRETLSNPSLRKNPMVPDGSEAPVYYRSLGTYRSYRKVDEKTGDVAWI